MEIYYTRIIESAVVIVIFIIIRIAVNQLIKRTIATKMVQKARSQNIRKAINFVLLLVSLVILSIIWGVEQSELAVFIGSILTIIGVAFFAQWSLLSNITSSIILFFNHTVKIGDSISILETKDYEIQGEVLNIGLFFTKIKLINTDDEITLPNNIFILKTIRKMNTSMDKSNIQNTLIQKELYKDVK